MAQAKAAGPDWALEAERELWRSICAPNSWFTAPDNEKPATHPYSLWHFLNKAWGAEFYLKSHPAEPQWLYAPIHVPYTQWLQLHLLAWKKASLTQKPGRYHIASVLPRGYGKTVSSTKAASLWTHLDDCDMTTLIQSATDPLSEDILGSIVAVMGGEDEDSWFCWLYGNWVTNARKKSKDSIKHAYRRAGNISEPSFDTSSAGIGATGYHPRQNWWDDPLIKNKLKQDRHAYLRGQHEAIGASYNSLHVNGLMCYTLTRYLDDDIAGRAFKEGGIATWTGMPCPHMALFDKVPFGEGIWHVFFYQTEDELTGEPTHPGLWSREMIAQAKARDPEDFACQQQNNPGSGERAPLVESQIPYLYLDYKDFLWDVQIKWATIHIDTAFKNRENIGRGDDSAIVVWLADARNNGILYLDTDLLRCSNEWREEDFNKELVKVCLALRRRGVYIHAITDETEPGGKEGTYKNRILGILRTAGFQIGDEQFIQFNRTKDKRARIRTAAGHWAEGYVRLLLNKGACDCPPPQRDPVTNREFKVPCPHFTVTPALRKLVYQIVKVDVTQHDDLADAATDGFARQLWLPPDTNPGIPSEGVEVRRPGDEELKSFARPYTTEELFAIIDERNELREAGYDDGIRGWDDVGDGWMPPREPV